MRPYSRSNPANALFARKCNSVLRTMMFTHFQSHIHIRKRERERERELECEREREKEKEREREREHIFTGFPGSAFSYLADLYYAS